MTFAIILGALIGLNVWATRRVRSREQSSFRRKMLVMGIWIVPLVGALVARDHTRIAPATSAPQTLPEVVEGDPAPGEISVPGSTTFNVIEHTGAVNGVPLLHWQALEEWASSIPDEPSRSEARDLGRRAWLLHLRDAIGPHFYLHETDAAYVLSSLERNVVVATAQYVAATRKRIGKVLEGVARFPQGEKVILLIFDDEESYYQYVATYYPEDGEFAFSGGMFIHAGCPHFVAKRADLTELEPVIAHEMTHMSVSYRQLPTWLDEGIAVNLERRLTGVRPLIYTPQELHEMHTRFWTNERIQEFWSGDSFHRTDDGNLLSYELARILVESFGRDWNAFAQFVSSADRSDAGAEAARNVLSVDLGASVCAVLGVEPTQLWSPQAALSVRSGRA